MTGSVLLFARLPINPPIGLTNSLEVLVLYRNRAGAACPHIILPSMRASNTALGLLVESAV